MALKKDLIKKLVDEYGYSKEDINTLTNAKLQKLIDDEEKDEKELQVEKEKPTVKQVKKFDAYDEITVMNGTLGALTHRSGLDGRAWKFTQFGQLDTMPYRELLAIKNSLPKMLTNGTIIIMNDDIKDLFNLTELYKNIITPDNIGRVFEKDENEMLEFIHKLPESMKQTFLQKSIEAYAENKIHDLRVIRVIESEFKISLEDNAPLDDKPLTYKKIGE